jgi:D-alanine-D-alanine ligase-like ATP-grasp enzyme
MYRDGRFYVLEVNTAPCLTDLNSDTLARYVRAFTSETD